MKRLLATLLLPLILFGSFIGAPTALAVKAPANCSGTVDTSKSGSTAAGIPAACDPAVNPDCDKSGCSIISNYVNPTITVLSYLVGIAVVIGVIGGAIQIITSAGDPQKHAKGQDHIRNALIALVAYALLFSFLKFLLPGISS